MKAFGKALMLTSSVLAVVMTVAGCTSPLLHEAMWNDALDSTPLPRELEKYADAMMAPVIPAMPNPATVLDPDRPPRYLSIAEAIALALERGTTGLQSVRAPGIAEDDLGGFSGFGVTGGDSIRVLSYQPARFGTAIEAGLARFDPFFSTSMGWSLNDEPTQGLSNFSNGHFANFSSALVKPLATGGMFGVRFNTDYQLLNNPPGGSFSVLNPSYFTRLQFGFEQPLLRDFGTEINQLRSSFPGSSLFPSANGRASAFSSEGILITRLRHDQSRAELERAVNFQLLNVHAAYWNLYGAYINLYVNEQGLKQAHMAWTIGKELMKEGKIDNSQLAQILAQYEQFRGERMRALGSVLDSERNLRVIIGLSIDDGTRLVPIETPITLPVLPDWQCAVQDALTMRPELLIARQDIIAKQMNLALQKNQSLPDLRLAATHTTVGLGSRLDGNGTFIDANGVPTTNNALRSLVGSHFNNWTVGLNMTVPLGYRFELAQVRDAQLALTQSYVLLKNHEQKAVTYLAKQYSQVIELSKLIEIRRAQRIAQADQVEARMRKYTAGIKESPLEFLLSAQQQWTFALNQEYRAIVDYNIALASLEFAKGTIMSANRVRISEGPLPEGVTIRAVDHERSGTNHRAWVAHNRARHSPTWPDGGAAPLVNLEQIGAMPSKVVMPDVPTPLMEVPLPPPLATLRQPAEARPAPAPATPSTPEIPSMPTLQPVEMRGPTPETPTTNASVPVRFGTPK